MSEWQPIETAPKDGKRVLLHTEKPFWETIGARWVGSPHNVWIADNGSYQRRATLWMPLPEPPK